MSNWFEMDRIGLRNTLAAKDKFFIIRELVQNAWDEESRGTNRVDINLTRPDEDGHTWLTVTDNSPIGFRNLSHAWTLYAGNKEKQANATLRGRFDEGLKTAICCALEATLTTTVGQICFSWEDFLARMSVVKPDWMGFQRKTMEGFCEQPHKVISGWEGRTIYFIKGGQHADEWAPDKAREDLTALLTWSLLGWGRVIQAEVEHLREVPVGIENFRRYEHAVRVVFNFLFYKELGEGRSQSRTEPEHEGVEIRDLLYSNKSDSGFWRDLKDKYSASEIVIDAKNKNELTRDDLRQLYCYLKPALGFWGFIVCRSEQPRSIQAFNRTLFGNFSQGRGVLLLSDDDLRRMVQMKNHGRDPSEYLRQRMSDFTRSI